MTDSSLALTLRYAEQKSHHCLWTMARKISTYWLWACSHQKALEFGEDPRGLPVSMNVECGLISLSSGLEMPWIVRNTWRFFLHVLTQRFSSSSTDIGGCFSVGRESCSKIIRWIIFSSCPVHGCWTTSQAEHSETHLQGEGILRNTSE